MSGAKFEVVKFDGQGNFGLWQTRVNDLLVHQGILKALRPTKPELMEEEDWEEFQQRATGTIRLCLADERLYGLKMQDDHDLAQHVNVFNQIVSDLARLDVKIEDEDKAMILLCLLPPSYEHMVTTLTYGKETIKVKEITVALLAHNQRKQNAEESSQVDSLYVKGNQDHGRKSEEAGYGKQNFRSKSRSVNYGSVYLGDDRCYNIVGIGDVRVQMYDGSVQTLCGVRYILDLKKNLISLGTLHKNDFIPKADEDRKTIRIVKGALTVIVLGKQTKVHFKSVKYTTEGILDYVHSDEHGIKRYFTVRKTPQQNGVTEWMNRSLNERARCLRLNVGLPKHFWTEAVNMACYLINRSSRASLAGKVAEKLWTGHDVTFNHLRIFDCSAYVRARADERSKLDAKSKECIFLGYKKGVKGFKFWNPIAKKIVTSKDVVFDEQPMLQQKKDTTVVDFEQFLVEKIENSQTTSGGSATDDLQDYSLARDRVRRTNINPLNILGFEDLASFALTVSSDDPVTFHDAVTSQENDKWMASMVEEMESLNHNRTWELVRLPEAKGYSQQKEVDYDEIFSPVVKHTSIRAVLALQPESFTQPGNEHLVCRLKKSLYGLKQSPRQWYKRFDSYMIKIGYKRYKEAEDMAKVSYSNDVGCLMYAMVCTHFDLAHDVSQVCKYMSKPGKQHWKAVKWIFRYLKGTVGHGIIFCSQRDNPLVVGYVDSDYAGDLDNRRSTTGYVFTLGGGPICWKSTVQSVVALSTTEAEYMAAAEAAKEALWLTGLVKELGVQQGGVQLLCDNQSTIHLAKNQVYRARTKHIDVRFH
ncbi:putative ribonuclease H protein [Hibiscus syriacus]|uniref:Ribonuclease H protein n=1 Tax=Hibiscus syriacus TaxID=106335 RepID=A0A6A3B327_HIBSY|nr:putative ribonuclease H protein [Hibiscus syriacus]